MGLPWIPIHTNLPGHPKSIALGAALNERRAWTRMVQVWLWAADHAPEGRLSARNGAILIEHAAEWDGERGAFIAAAEEAGFVDRDADGTFIIHDWDLINGAHIAKRARDAERQKARRLRLLQGGQPDAQETSDVRPRDVRVTSNDNPRESQGERERERESREEDDHVGLADAETEHPRSEDLRAVWNSERAPEMSEWRKSKSPKRRKAVNARLRERPDLDEWREAIRRLAKSDFARGLVPGRDGRRWLASPAFLLQPDAVDKVFEGTYDNRPGQTRPTEEAKCTVL